VAKSDSWLLAKIASDVAVSRVAVSPTRHGYVSPSHNQIIGIPVLLTSRSWFIGSAWGAPSCVADLDGVIDRAATAFRALHALSAAAAPDEITRCGRGRTDGLLRLGKVK